MKKRRLALFMALVLLFTSLNGISLGVSAEEVMPVAEEAVELLLEEDGVETVLPEADLSAAELSVGELPAEEIVMPVDPADESVILDEEILVVEEIEELHVSDMETPPDLNAAVSDAAEIVENILIEDTEAVEDMSGELLSSETLPEEPAAAFANAKELTLDTQTDLNITEDTVLMFKYVAEETGPYHLEISDPESVYLSNVYNIDGISFFPISDMWFYKGETYYLEIACYMLNPELTHSIILRRGTTWSELLEAASTLPAKTENGDYHLETGTEDFKWYTFTPDQDGCYLIESNSSALMVVHQENAEFVIDNSLPVLMGDAYPMKKNVTYCIGFKGNFYEPDSNMISMYMLYKGSVTDIAVSNTKDSYVEGLEDFMQLMDFHVTYSDGGTGTVDDWSITTVFNPITQQHNNPFWEATDSVYNWQMQAQLKQNDTFYDPSHGIAAGDYVLECFWEYEKLMEIPIKIRSLEEADIPELTVGESLINSGEEETAPILYKFTAAEKGSYRISDFNTLYVYKKTENGYEYDIHNSSCFLELEADETCYIGFLGSVWDSILADSVYSFQISIKKIPKLANISIKRAGLSKKVYIEQTDYFNSIYRASLQLTYDDETTSTVYLNTNQVSVTDAYGNCIESIWYKDNELYSGPRTKLTSGKYEITFCCGSLSAEKTICFSVFSMYEFAQEVTVGTESEVICTDGAAMVTFSAPVSSTYTIKVYSNILGIYVYDEIGNRISTASSVYLQANKVYYCYYRLRADKKDSVKFVIESRPLITKAEVIAKQGTYYAGAAELGDTIEVKLTYENGMTAVVKNDDMDNYGNRIECYLLTEEGKQDYSALRNSDMDTGTYTIYPAVINTNSDSELYSPETVVPTEISLTLPYSDELPVLFLNTYERIPSGCSKWYAFTATQDGTYDYLEERLGFIDISIYTAGEKSLRTQSGAVSLKAGETCYIYLDASAAGKVKIINTDLSMDTVIPGAELPEILTLDQLYRVVVKEADGVFVTFTPSEDGLYTIESSNRYKTDPCVYLYDAESGECLYSDDDSGGDRNFKLARFLRAGKTYQYQLKDLYGRAGGFSVFFSNATDEIKTVEGIDFMINTDGMSELSSSNLEAYIYMKLAYSDGSTEIISLEPADDFFNRYDYRIEQTAETKTQIQYELTVTYYNTVIETVDEAKTAQITFSAKKLNALSAFPLDYTVSINGFHAARYDYQFTPQESGEYILSKTCPADTYSFVQVSELGGKDDLYALWSAGTDTTNSTAYHMDKGSTYIITIHLYSYENMKECSAEYRLTKGNEVTSVELIRLPEQRTVVPGTYVLSLAGLEAKITYRNGEQQTIAYGSADSYGKTFRTDYTWINDQTFGVNVWFGDCMVSFTLPAETEELKNLTVLLENVRTEFRGFAFFTPERSAAYDVFLTYSAIASPDTEGFCFYDQNGKQVSSTYDQADVDTYWLEQGQTYLAAYGDPDITVSVLIAEEDNCKWETISQTEPTCTTNGERKEYCTWHEDERVVVLPAIGHTITMTDAKAATCTETGLTAKETCSVCKTLIKGQITIPAKGHRWNAWTETKATVLVEGSKTHTCTVCKTKETVKTADKLTPTIELTAKKVTLQTGQSTKKFKVTGLAAGDSIVSMKLAKNKSVKISSVNLKNGTCRLTALKKTGKAKLKITLASGLKKTVTIQVQKGAVKPTSIKVASKEITLKKKQKLSLKPEVLPFTCTEKLTYKTSDKKIVTVSSKGVLKGIKAGKAKITIQAGKKKVTVTVTVKKK